ncbi:LacI family DNA-binding transcriptional regulator [uncultured Paludibaculum sp.]|uniref:LacI family DNA-binding transcriptional regulator n=1 Tax=uncultured Paludibaculum sp. TaxID=1765020 RepID=UPI002AAAAFED|nr:LacI family DNA-binding transcriptional regulator [uncultured Paludibaculum sp.]
MGAGKSGKQPGRKPIQKTGVTLSDIAKAMGLSAMTVSRAFTGSAQISETTKQEVLKRAKELGYVPNRWARSLVTRRSSIIGVLIPEISHTYFAEVTCGVEEIVDKTGFDLLLCHSRGDAEKERAEIHMLIGTRADGLIIASVQDAKTERPFAELEDAGIPFVLVDRFFPNRRFSSVLVDDQAVGEIATSHLVGLGHKLIAHIQGPPVTPAVLRKRGYLAVMKAQGLTVDKDWIVGKDFSNLTGYSAMRKLLQLKPRPTAVFAANDPLAIGAVRACREVGLRVPEDISVVGAGCIEGDHNPSPFLTTVWWPNQEMGRAAAQLLLDAIADSNGGETHIRTFAPKLLVRHSSGPPPAK